MDFKKTSSLVLQDARPYAFTSPLATTALIIIDVQRDFVDDGGFGSVQCGDPEIFSRARSIVPAVQRVLEYFRSVNGHVIHTREGHQPNLADLPASKRLRQMSAPNGHHTLGIGDQGPMGKLLVRGEYGHDIIQELTPWPDESVIDKPGKGSFWGTDIHRVLLARGITHLIFAGVTTECCVTSTLRECNDRGYQCCVLSDCTAGFDAQQVATSLETVCRQDGLFGFVGTSHDLLDPIIAATTSSSDPTTPPSTPPVLSSDDKLPGIDELLMRYRKAINTPADVIEVVFDRIDKYKSEDAAVWIDLETREACVAAARSLVDKYAGKPLPPLFGIPFSVKDSIDVAGKTTTTACPSYAHLAESSAVAVQHLLDAGAIYIGKVNLDQLATGLNGTRSPYGVPHSVFSKKHISGGSSSGSAVSVGAGLVSFSLQTDTAGSGRVPAACNGIVGFKPTKGTVSARGLVPACRTLDTIAVAARSVKEARKVWRIIARHDPQDPFAKLPRSLPTWSIDYRGPRAGGFTMAVPPDTALGACSNEFLQLFHKTIEIMTTACGGKISQLDPVDYSVFEKANNLLYDASLLHERVTCLGLDFLQGNLDTLHPVIRDLFSKALASPPSAYDVFRDQALQTQLTRTVQQMFDPLVGGLDVLIVPTIPLHPTIEAIEADPLALNSRMGVFTHFANVVDMCGVSVPAGTYELDDGVRMPFAVTVLGASGYDAKVLDIAAVLEEVIAGGDSD